MRLTNYGASRFEVEADLGLKHFEAVKGAQRALALGGATLHAYMVGVDLGEHYVLTGSDAYGKRMRREAGSAVAVYAIARAAWGYKRAWHIREDGTRRLIFSR